MAPSRLRDLGERRIVSELLRLRYERNSAFGDDCALVPIPAGPVEVVATTDPCPFPLVIALGLEGLYHWGWLLATINLSDLAAAGAHPAGLLTSYTVPADLSTDDFEALLRGVDDCCADAGTLVVGGNIKDGELSLAATALGWCEPGRRITRSGVVPGQVAVLIGRPGVLWSFALVERGYARVTATSYSELRSHAERPRAKLIVARELAARGIARAAIDVSDGLYGALGELCRTNGCGIVLDHGVPRISGAVADVAEQARIEPLKLASLWGDWNLVVAVERADLAACVSIVESLGEEAHVLGAFTLEPSITVSSDTGRHEVWDGIDFERFTPESWTSSLLESIVADLVGSVDR
jgi:thiamine-monophosphate kinase